MLDYLVGRDYDMINSHLSTILYDNDVVLDIGANMGQYLMRLSKFIKKGKIICIEPIPENLQALNTVKRFLKIKNCEIIPKAISETVMKTNIYIPQMNQVPIATRSTLSGELIDGDVEVLEIETTTIDKIFDELRLKKIDFIKVDTEGHDSIVLKSGKNVINCFKPLIRLEENVFNGNFSWLFDIGYNAFMLNDNHRTIIINEDNRSEVKEDLYLATEDRLKKILLHYPLERTISSFG